MRPSPVDRTGVSLPAREIGPITPTDIVRFAGAGGDFNRLHHDSEFATAAGFAGVIAMGQMQAGMLAAYLADWCGVENLRSYGVRFMAPVRPGDVLVMNGEVVRISDGPPERLADVELRISCNDVPVVTAKATVVARQ